MDPTAMEFMMHQPDHAGSSSAIDHAARSSCPCPALRAAAEQNQHSPVHPPNRQSTQHYDPVHSSTYSNLWHQRHAAAQSWNQIPIMMPPNPRFMSDTYPPPSTAVPSRSNQAGHSSYSTSNDSEAYHPHLSRSSFHYSRPPMSNLQTVGSTAPIQHSQGVYLGFGQAQTGAGVGIGTGIGTEAHTSRTNGTFPVPNPVSSQTTSQTSQAPAFSDSAHANQQSDSHGSPYFSMPPMSFSAYRGDSSGSLGRGDETESSQPASQSPPRRLPPVSNATPSGQVESNSNPPELRRASVNQWTPMIRRLTSPSSSSSDNDTDSMDQIDPDPVAYQFFEGVSGDAAEDRVRAHQILRGTVTGKRIASKKAITSLESVNISDLPESEKTCVICYNDFGVETPEGINEAPLRLPKCKHVFGDHCIKKWFEESDSCPYCRDKVPSEPQYRHSSNAHNVYRFIRQHQMHVQQLQQQAARQSLEQRERSDPGRTMFTGISSSSSPFAEFGYDTLGETASRRAENHSVFYGSRPHAWHNTPERRSPPNEFNENRRRTRARHGSLRGSPPSARPHLFGSSATNGASPPYAWFNRPSPNHAHNHRHSMASSGAPVRPAFDVNISPFASSLGGPSEHYLNPLNVTNAGNSVDDYRPLPQMRSQFPSPLSPTIGGSDIYMAYSDDATMGRATSQQQS